MTEMKTTRNKGDVEAFLNSGPGNRKRKDSFTLSSSISFQGG